MPSVPPASGSLGSASAPTENVQSHVLDNNWFYPTGMLTSESEKKKTLLSGITKLPESLEQPEDITVMGKTQEKVDECAEVRASSPPVVASRAASELGHEEQSTCGILHSRSSRSESSGPGKQGMCPGSSAWASWPQY